MHGALQRIGLWRWLWATLATAACTNPTGPTDLHPEGPPMIEQVRLIEVYASGSGQALERSVFGFGTHPLATADDQHVVTSAKAAGNKLRIIMDELLRGNDLEEIACRYAVGDDVFARVPLGVTPDDIARCAVAQDLLISECPGANRRSVCLCQRAGGCPSGIRTDGTPHITPKGESVGVLDRDQDGAVDDFRFLEGAVGITCGAIDVPIDVALSYWTPSGSQHRPAQGGFDALGPAVVVVPRGALPTNLACGVTFSPAVVDPDGHQVCAPPHGDVTGACRPGDTSAVRFTVEPLTFSLVLAIVDPGQPRMRDVRIKANVPLDPASIANITVTEDPATSYTQFTATRSQPNEITLHWTAPGGLAAATRYTITIPTTVTDGYQQAAVQPFVIAFTTSAT
jgi:Bacterial Ig-like domain